MHGDAYVTGGCAPGMTRAVATRQYESDRGWRPERGAGGRHKVTVKMTGGGPPGMKWGAIVR